jgi:hypothetical protein
VGEIGIRRREFLYDIQFWEVRRILRGYNRRNMLQHRLLRLAAYGSVFSMRDPKGKSPEDWYPLPGDKESAPPPPSEDEKQELLDLIESVNKNIDQGELEG